MVAMRVAVEAAAAAAAAEPVAVDFGMLRGPECGPRSNLPTGRARRAVEGFANNTLNPQEDDEAFTIEST